MAYGGERADSRALDELEGLLRLVSEELASWRARAIRAEGEGKGSGGGRGDGELKTRVADLEADNKALRQRLEAARVRVNDLLGRLSFLEEQTREPGVAGAGAGAGAGAAR